MLIEQIIELVVGGLGSPCRTCTPKTGHFYAKQKSPKSNAYSRDYYLLLKILQEAMYFASTTWAKFLTKFNPKIQDFKRVLDLIYK